MSWNVPELHCAESGCSCRTVQVLPVLQRAAEAGHLCALLFLASCPGQHCRPRFSPVTCGPAVKPHLECSALMLHIQTRSHWKKFHHLFRSYNQAFVCFFFSPWLKKTAESNCKLIPCENKPQSCWNVCACLVEMLSAVCNRSCVFFLLVAHSQNKRRKKKGQLTVLLPGLSHTVSDGKYCQVTNTCCQQNMPGERAGHI